MDYDLIKLDMKDAIAIITLNHPEVLNAMGIEMLSEVKHAIGMIETPENSVRCLLITGAGRGFCSGANLAPPSEGVEKDVQMVVREGLDATYNPLFLRLRDLRMPIVTAVNGPAAGVGMSLALMGDIILAARSAYFLQAFKRIGLIPDGGATYILPRLVGLARAMELSLLAERLPAETALEWGLINRVCDDDKLMTDALNYAKELATGPTVALSLIRKAYRLGLDNSYEEQLHVESILQTEAGQTEDNREGVAAFLEKRPARFKGK